MRQSAVVPYQQPFSQYEEQILQMLWEKGSNGRYWRGLFDADGRPILGFLGPDDVNQKMPDIETIFLEYQDQMQDHARRSSRAVTRWQGSVPTQRRWPEEDVLTPAPQRQAPASHDGGFNVAKWLPLCGLVLIGGIVCLAILASLGMVALGQQAPPQVVVVSQPAPDVKVEVNNEQPAQAQPQPESSTTWTFCPGGVGLILPLLLAVFLALGGLGLVSSLFARLT